MDQKKTTIFVGVLIVLVLLIAGSIYFFNSKEDEVVAPNTQVLSEDDSNVFDEFVQEQELTLSPGESGTFEGLTVTFNKITEDNRCPTSVQCIVAGRVVGEFKLEDSTASKTVLISSDAAEPYSFTGYFVQIKEVRPTKVNPGILDPNAYEIVLIVSRNAKL